MAADKIPKSIIYEKGELLFLDQTLLPLKIYYEKQENIEQVYNSIKTLKVRGAPAIGIAAAFGLAVCSESFVHLPVNRFKEKFFENADYIISARPTAVNLSWAAANLTNIVKKYAGDDCRSLIALLKKEASRIYEEDKAVCKAIGIYGADLIRENCGILTHCNAGALAVSELGTALAPVYTAMDRGVNFRVYADETRPLLQGARLTSWELQRAGADVTLICDNMAAFVMSKGLVDMVITGCDRVAANGDTANKIGTLGVAILAEKYNIPFYIACPYSTFDISASCADDIIIEERAAWEVTEFAGVKTAPDNIKVLNPAFDVTPNELIKGFITEKGIIEPPFSESLKRIFAREMSI